MASPGVSSCLRGIRLLRPLVYVVTGGEAFRRNEVTYVATILTYFIAGVLGGTMGGALLPMTTTRLGSVAFGIIVGFPVCACFGWLVSGPIWAWDWIDYSTTVTMAILLGGALGYYEWRPPNPSREACGGREAADEVLTIRRTFNDR